jgi:pentatricopeptide repeat protein
MASSSRTWRGDEDDVLRISRNLLASAYLKAGRLDEAISLFEEALAQRVAVLGHRHPATLTTPLTILRTLGSCHLGKISGSHHRCHESWPDSRPGSWVDSTDEICHAA